MRAQPRPSGPAERAREIERLYPAARGLMPYGEIKTWWGVEVGAIRSAAAFEAALEKLKP